MVLVKHLLSSMFSLILTVLFIEKKKPSCKELTDIFSQYHCPGVLSAKSFWSTSIENFVIPRWRRELPWYGLTGKCYYSWVDFFRSVSFHLLLYFGCGFCKQWYNFCPKIFSADNCIFLCFQKIFGLLLTQTDKENVYFRKPYKIASI